MKTCRNDNCKVDYNYAICNYQSEFNREAQIIERNSNRYYCYLQHIDGGIASFSLTNPFFDLFQITDFADFNHCYNMKDAISLRKNSKNEIIYCASKIYGTFYTNKTRNCIYQCCINDFEFINEPHLYKQFKNGEKSFVIIYD